MATRSDMVRICAAGPSRASLPQAVCSACRGSLGNWQSTSLLLTYLYTYRY